LFSAREPVLNNVVIRGKLLSEEGQLTLIVLALALDVVASSRLRDVIGEIQTTIDDDLTGTGLTTRLSGVPVTQPEIRNAVEPRPTALQCIRLHGRSSDRHTVLPLLASSTGSIFVSTSFSMS
jgi:hypothetical protein